MKSILFAVPFLNEAENLRCIFLFIDDGSTDESLSIVKSWKEKDILYISFSKNYGSHIALFSALEKTNTDYFTFMSSDMQEPVTLYSEMFLLAESKNAECLLKEKFEKLV